MPGRPRPARPPWVRRPSLADTLEQVLDGGLPPDRAARERLRRLAQALAGGTSP